MQSIEELVPPQDLRRPLSGRSPRVRLPGSSQSPTQADPPAVAISLSPAPTPPWVSSRSPISACREAF